MHFGGQCGWSDVYFGNDSVHSWHDDLMENATLAAEKFLRS